MFNKKVFSIVVPNFNSDNKLRPTIESVLNQANKTFELIIIDSCSSDKSRDTIDEYKEFIDKIVIEKDEGIYDAMNKGVKYATGKYIFFLGAGDTLEENILEKVSKKIPSDGVNFVYGNVYYGNKKNKIYDGKFNQYKLTKINICHQAIFYSREIFSMIGDYNLKYKIFSDWAYNIKCFGDERIKKIYIDDIISTYQDDGISSRIIDSEFINDYVDLIKDNFSKTLYLFVSLKHKVKNLIGKV